MTSCAVAASSSLASTSTDHIDYIKKKAGIDHVGIGSDFDGIDV